MENNVLGARVMRPISTGELERRWKAVRAVMKEQKIDFLLIQNNNDYLGGYLKWLKSVSVTVSIPSRRK